MRGGKDKRMGSPPHMRGKGTLMACRSWLIGITPAHAGKSSFLHRHRLCFWDHPRTCGEKCRRPDTQVPVPGSPPHMRGKAYMYICIGTATRITPAHAGKSNAVGAGRKAGEDHPRTCGEKQAERGSIETRRGSPPHMRGKAGFLRASSFLTGITPAHAGKRHGMIFFSLLAMDHPRTCGEKTRDDFFQFVGNGSPPHMRGKVKLSSITGYLGGITPAHAGKRVAVYR